MATSNTCCNSLTWNLGPPNRFVSILFTVKSPAHRTGPSKSRHTVSNCEWMIKTLTLPEKYLGCCQLSSETCVGSWPIWWSVSGWPSYNNIATASVRFALVGKKTLAPFRQQLWRHKLTQRMRRRTLLRWAEKRWIIKILAGGLGNEGADVWHLIKKDSNSWAVLQFITWCGLLRPLRSIWDDNKVLRAFCSGSWLL